MKDPARHPTATCLLLLALLIAHASGCCPPSAMPPPQNQGQKPSEPLEAKLQTFDGGETTLAAYAGQVVMVDFWASWCGPCRLAFPYYADIQERHRGEGFLVVAVSIDETMEQGRSFARRWGLPFELLYDGDRQAQAAFSVYQIPASFLLDRHGRVRFVHRGFDSQRVGKLEEEVMFLLAEPAPAG